MPQNQSERRGGGNRRPNERGNRASRGLTRRARRDVRAAFKPQMNMLEREETRAEKDASQYGGQVENLYENLGGQLSGLGAQYQERVGGIEGGLQDSLGSLTGMLGGTPAGEQGAAAGLFATVGGGALEGLASQKARGVGFDTSTQRQAAIDNANYQANVLEELKQFKQALSDQRLDLTGEMAPLILSRIDELKQRAQEMALANKEFKLRQMATTQGLGLDKARFGLERQRFGTEQRAADALAGLTEAQVRALLEKIRRQRGGG